MLQRRQLCSWTHGVPTARPQIPVETLRRSKWPRNSCHSASVGTRCSSVGRMARRRDRNARCELDGLVGVDSFVAHGDVDVAVAGDPLGDMRWQPAHDRVGDEQPSKIMGRESQWLTGCWVGQAGAEQCGGENVANDVRADPAALGAESALEQQRRWWQPYTFLPVVGGDQWDLAGVVADPVDDRAEHIRQFRRDQ